MKMKKNEIHVVYGEDIAGMTRHLLETADLAAMIPSRDVKIGIKPNLVGQVTAEDGATTHREVVRALVEYLQEKGFGDLVVLESSWVGDSTEQTVRFLGYDRMLEELGVPFWDLQKDRGVSRDCAGMEMQVCERVPQIGFLINVPVLKGHCQTRMTCALKNMKGLIPGSEKRRFHRLGLHEPIGHLAAGIRQDFILVDSICGDLTMEDGGSPVQQDRLIAACDPVLCDTYCCRLLEIDPARVPYIGIAAGLGAGSVDLDRAVVRAWREATGGEAGAPGERSAGGEAGAHAYLPAPDLTLKPTPSGWKDILRISEKAEAVDSCSACYGYLIPALQMLEQEGLLERLTEKVCIGQGYRGKRGVLGIGSCTRLFDHTLAGCPPTETQMYQFLKDFILAGEQEAE